MSPNSKTPFDLIDEGDLAQLRDFIIKNPPSILNRLDGRGNSLLSRAVLNGDLEMVKTLCNAGVDLHACDLDKGGEPALMYAFDSGDEAIIVELLERSQGVLRALPRGWVSRWRSGFAISFRKELETGRAELGWEPTTLLNLPVACTADLM